NHDIPNGEKAAPGAALRGTESAAGAATEEDFQRIYEADGWSDASRRDTGSLSYAAPLAPGLLLLALDSRALDNGREAAGGNLSAETRRWAQGVLADARRSSTRVIVLIHHGVMEHFRGERTFVPGALVADDDAVAELLAAGGVRVVFSGHGHAQDITKRSFPLRGEDYPGKKR
ncbi:MAG: metallophosphoesterase, partial [Spirochaetia bacterium]